MKILFYSERCKFSSELISKLKDTNFSKEFQHINIDKNQVPSQIKVVPTIIDSEYKDLLEGKKAFEYIFNKKYFDNPTNNLLLWKDKDVPNPNIKEDKLATNLSSHATTESTQTNNSSYFSFDNFNDKTIKEIKVEDKPKEEIVEEPRKIKISQISLLRLKGRR